jgi:hypothetical protein
VASACQQSISGQYHSRAMELDRKNIVRNTTLKLIDLQLSMIKLEDQMKALQEVP